MVKNLMKVTVKVCCTLGIIAGTLFAGAAFADGASDAVSMSDMQSGLQSTFNYAAEMVSGAALIGGVFLFIVGILKIKQHQEMKMQGQPKLMEAMAIMTVAVGLLAAPVVMNSATKAVFGSSTDVQSIDGASVSTLLGGT